MHKVLYVMSSDYYSGAEIVLFNLLENNEKVAPIILSGRGKVIDRAKANKVEFFQTKYLDSFKFMRVKGFRRLFMGIRNSICLSIEVIRLVQSQKEIIAIHCNNNKVSFYCLFSVVYFSLFKRNLIRVRHNHDISYIGIPKKVRPLLDFIFGSFFNIIIVPSQATKNQIKWFQSKVTVLYNGFFLSDYMEVPKLIKRDETNDLILGIAGKISKEKGHLLLLDVMKELHDKSIKLKIAGLVEEEFKEEFLSRLEDAGEKVEYLGFIDTMFDFYNNIDVVINATSKELSEPLGTTLIEGLMHNKILIASKVGGSTEIIEDKVNGFLFENKQELISILLEITNNRVEYVDGDILEKKLPSRFYGEKMVEDYNYLLHV
ncbi:glycosyltransferase family 4 protein [Reichenbachiella agarivorans]|uniref:Glycosyltransferase family 4 protein n=1 Tax=Reichenbachiella agarivorans TaxID=2979464 RepID=A0ABY6CVY6_9BACT|nr:glycosyltransferase family 4 protein [Reichenbachiella agarivorans]UXP33553.1 glycosyltransferase family 4 protein [Reichenbachiella agarivorans]